MSYMIIFSHQAPLSNTPSNEKILLDDGIKIR